MKMKLKIREPTSAWRRRNWTLEVPTGMDHGFLEYEQACIFAVMRQWLVVHTFQNRWREVQGALKYMSDSCWHKCHNTMKHMYVYIYRHIHNYIYTHINMCTLYIRTQFCGLLWDMRDPAIQTCWSRFGTCTMLHLNLHLFPWNRIPHVQ
jgi:hypothetical protein